MKTLQLNLIALLLTSSVAVAQTSGTGSAKAGQSVKTASAKTTMTKKTQLNPETKPAATSQPILPPGTAANGSSGTEAPGSTLEPAIVPGNPTYPSTIVPGNTVQPASPPEVSRPNNAATPPVEPAVVPGNPTYPAVNSPTTVNETNSGVNQQPGAKTGGNRRTKKRK